MFAGPYELISLFDVSACCLDKLRNTCSTVIGGLHHKGQLGHPLSGDHCTAAGEDVNGARCLDLIRYLMLCERLQKLLAKLPALCASGDG